MTSESRIIRSADHADSPVVGKYDDAFVRLVGWYWTEGWNVERGRSGRSVIGQSSAANPLHVAAIRAALSDQFPGGWSETVRPDGMVYFQLCVAASAALREVTGSDKQPTPLFLRSLTQAQLTYLIASAIDGDGTIAPSGQRTWRQVSQDGVDAMQMACALAGVATHAFPGAHARDRYGRTPTQVSVLRRSIAKPVDAARQAARQAARTGGAARDRLVTYEGRVWCPQTPSTAWLARRDGSVYWTGNCIDNGGGGAGTSGATVGGVLFNHKGIALGTKASGSTWTFTVTVTQS